MGVGGDGGAKLRLASASVLADASDPSELLHHFASLHVIRSAALWREAREQSAVGQYDAAASDGSRLRSSLSPERTISLTGTRISTQVRASSFGARAQPSSSRARTSSVIAEEGEEPAGGYGDDEVLECKLQLEAVEGAARRREAAVWHAPRCSA